MGSLKFRKLEIDWANGEISRYYISQVERGKRNVTLFNLLRLAVALEVLPSHLVSPFDTHAAVWPPRADQVS
jgi:transcriptional regulator with XRE-family HTH domain